MELITKELTIRTYKGILISLIDPQPDDIFIEDIAHGLAYQYRYGGHCFSLITVAEHSLRVYNRCKSLSALMHDASEAYLGDLKSPIKALCPDYSEIEHRFMRVIADKFGIAWPIPFAIKQADQAEFDWEQENIMIEKEGMHMAMKPLYAKERFLKTFETIY
ncbi:hypothetical protein D3C72_932240 [compost metagenome]